MIHHQPITIKDIARTLGVSVATVSRAMRDTYDVSPETRKRVLSMAKALNYKPNVNAQGLVTSHTRNIGIVLPLITNYYFSTVFTGIQEVAWNKGYDVTLYVTHDSREKECSILESLSLSRLDGLIACISSESHSSEHFQKIVDRGTPLVFFDRTPKIDGTSRVTQDDVNGAREAVTHLIASGYSQIAHISGPRGLGLTEGRVRGYCEALAAHGLPIREDWIVHSGFSQQHGEEDVRQLFQGSEKPDAIFAVNDRKAVGAILALKAMNIQVGKEVGVIGFTNDPVSDIISPRLSTIAEPAFEIGQHSAEILIQHITRKNFASREVVLPGKLIVRESTIRT